MLATGQGLHQKYKKAIGYGITGKLREIAGRLNQFYRPFYEELRKLENGQYTEISSFEMETGTFPFLSKSQRKEVLDILLEAHKKRTTLEDHFHPSFLGDAE